MDPQDQDHQLAQMVQHLPVTLVDLVALEGPAALMDLLDPVLLAHQLHQLDPVVHDLLQGQSNQLLQCRLDFH